MQSTFERLGCASHPRACGSCMCLKPASSISARNSACGVEANFQELSCPWARCARTATAPPHRQHAHRGARLRHTIDVPNTRRLEGSHYPARRAGRGRAICPMVLAHAHAHTWPARRCAMTHSGRLLFSPAKGRRAKDKRQHTRDRNRSISLAKRPKARSPFQRLACSNPFFPFEPAQTF